MKRTYFILLFIIIGVGNIVTTPNLDASKLNLKELLFNASAQTESSTKYIQICSHWTINYDYCGSEWMGDRSSCDFLEYSCQENPNGPYDSCIDCTIIDCYDCETGLHETTYDDC